MSAITEAYARLMARSVRAGDGCLVWTGAVRGSNYSTITVAGKQKFGHRVAVEFHRGPIPPGMTVDHLCHNKRCVEISHLEVVTGAENSRRAWSDGLLAGTPAAVNAAKTECKYGHPYTQQNTKFNKRGHRYCRECNAAKSRALRAKRRAER